MRTILALDDSNDVLALRSYFFGTAGYQVKTFQSPRLALMSLIQSPVDLVLTDYEMPEMNGLEFARYCRLLGFAGSIVMVTGATMIERGQFEHIDALVSKGGSPSALLSLVQRYLQDGRAVSRQATIPSPKEIDTNEAFSSASPCSSASRAWSASTTDLPIQGQVGRFFDYPGLELSVVS